MLIDKPIVYEMEVFINDYLNTIDDNIPYVVIYKIIGNTVIIKSKDKNHNDFHFIDYKYIDYLYQLEDIFMDTFGFRLEFLQCIKY